MLDNMRSIFSHVRALRFDGYFCLVNAEISQQCLGVVILHIFFENCANRVPRFSKVQLFWI